MRRVSGRFRIAPEPIGYVRTRATVEELRHRKAIGEIVVKRRFLKAIEGLKDFSHLFVIFWMHEIATRRRRPLRVHPRGRTDIPKVGIFATRTPHRPNPMGLTVVKLLRIRENVLKVQGLDAFDGTPVLDLKPYDKWDSIAGPRVPGWWKKLERERLRQERSAVATS